MTRVPKYRKHPNGQAFVQYRKKRHYLGRYGEPKSREAYRKFLARIDKPDDPNRPTALHPGRDYSIAELIVVFLAYSKGRYGSSGHSMYDRMLFSIRALDELYGEEDAADFTPAKLMRIQEHLAAQKRTRNKRHLNLARSEVNVRVNRIKRFFKWACREGHVESSIVYGLSCVEPLARGQSTARETKKVGPVTLEVVRATLPFVSPTVAQMIQVHYLCGMRSGEVCIMRPMDIDQSGVTWWYKPQTHKGEWLDEVRIIPVPQVAQQILAPLIAGRPADAYLFDPREAEQLHRPTRPKKVRKTKQYPCELKRIEREKLARRKHPGSRIKERYSTASYRRAIDYGRDRAKKANVTIPHWHPHQLRHAISTEISRVLGQQASQRWLGHKHLKTTDIYAEKTAAELAEIAQAMDKLWSSNALDTPAAKPSA